MVFSITNLHRFLDCHTKPCSNRRGRNHRPWWNGSWSYRRLRRWKGPKSRQWHGPKIPFLFFFLFRLVFLYKTVCVTWVTKPIDPKICYCCVYLLSELCNLHNYFERLYRSCLISSIDCSLRCSFKHKCHTQYFMWEPSCTFSEVWRLFLWSDNLSVSVVDFERECHHARFWNGGA